MSRDHVLEQVDEYLDHSDHPESEALNVLHHLMHRFGWTGTVMARGDVEGWLDRALTEDEWEAVQNSWSWRNAGSTWNEMGATWETVTAAIDEAGLRDDDDEPDHIKGPDGNCTDECVATHPAHASSRGDDS